MRELAVFLMLMPLAGFAQTLRVVEAFVVPPAAGVAGVAPVLVLENRGTETLLLQGASTPVAETVQLRYHTHRNGLARIEIGPFELPPRSRVRLLPGASELWLAGLTQPLQPGTEFPLTLQLGPSQTRVVRVQVQHDTGNLVPVSAPYTGH